MYPRVTAKGRLVSETQIVLTEEHLINRHQVFFLSGAIRGDLETHNLMMVADTLNELPLKLVITSPGGDLDSAFLLYDTLRLMRRPIYTLGRFCASAATLILAVGQRRYLLPHSKVMLHLPSGAMGGDARDWEIQHREMEKYKEKLVSALQECGVKKNRVEILADIDRDKWFEPEEAIEYGLADEVMTRETMRVWLQRREDDLPLELLSGEDGGEDE